MADYTGCTSYTAAGLVTNIEGNEVSLVSVLTNSHITMDPKAYMTDHDAERDVECDAERDVKCNTERDIKRNAKLE